MGAPRSRVKLVAKMLKAIHAQESKMAAREEEYPDEDVQAALRMLCAAVLWSLYLVKLLFRLRHGTAFFCNAQHDIFQMPELLLCCLLYTSSSITF